MIEELIETLNTTGVTFVRDAWDSAPGGDYGVVDVAENTVIWRDDEPGLRRLVLNVWLYTTDLGESVAQKVEAVLKASDKLVSYRQAERSFINNPVLVRHHWQITLAGVD